MTKRSFDIALSVAGLIALSPVLAVVAALVWLSSGRPVLFRQTRMGRDFRPFRLLKFRTMVNGAEATGFGITVGADPRADPRITTVGRWLRRTKLDELPQLWNVLRGDMSFVGPRPELPRYVDLFRDDYAPLLRVRPGITDFASLTYRNEAALLSGAADPELEYRDRILPDKLRLSASYLDRSTLGSDIALIVRTVLGRSAGPALEPPARPFMAGEHSGVSATPNTRQQLLRFLVSHRRLIVVAIQLVLITASSYTAFWLRLDGNIAPEEMDRFLRTLPWLLAIRAVTFVPFRLYEGLWRYTSIWDLSRIINGVLTSTVLFWMALVWQGEHLHYPRSVFIIDSGLLIMMMGGIRLTRRMRHEIFRPLSDRRVLIVGAGDAGEMLVRDMRMRGTLEYAPVGFIDDDPRKRGLRIHGVKVLGDRTALPRVIDTLKPSEVVIAIPSLAPVVMRELVTALEPFKVRISTLPRLTDIVDGRVAVSQVRDLSIEDLLPRAPVGLDPMRLQDLVRDRCVLVTGAGGSIGSELCRQLAQLKPRMLVLYERHENGLYAIASELEDAGYGAIVRPMIGDVTDRARLDYTFGSCRPNIVFHAAAHKHVPLMELHVCEAVKNNVMGTRMVAESSIRHGVDRFILISTDKAVEPSSVMGVTKRVAELTMHAITTSARGASLAAVRFGNVLGSNGSVVPRFLAQIRSGGPVTVTHPEMRRYFMLIPEAVHLLLHAAALEEHARKVYVLDMGDQLNLCDMARKLIRLSGFVPDEEIAITYVGLRPGEKLSERLVAEDEVVEPTSQEKILGVAPMVAPDVAHLAPRLAELEMRALQGDAAAVMRLLHDLVPSFATTVMPATATVVDITKHRPLAAAPRPARARIANVREYTDRRGGPPDRRITPRGGRRLADRVRLAMNSAAPAPQVAHATLLQERARESARSV